MIYIISSIDGCNLVYVKTREEAVHICELLPKVFKWEALDVFES